MSSRVKAGLMLTLSVLSGVVAFSTGGLYAVDAAFDTVEARASRPPTSPVERQALLETALLGGSTRSRTAQALLLLRYDEKRREIAKDEIARARINLGAFSLALLSAVAAGRFLLRSVEPDQGERLDG